MVRSADQIAEFVNELYRKDADKILVGASLSTSTVDSRHRALTELAEMVQITQPTSMWVYDFRDFVMVLLGWLLTLVPTGLRPIVDVALGNLK